MSRNFFETTTDTTEHEWRFPAPKDEAEWAKFINESTLNIYAAAQERETPMTLDLALPSIRFLPRELANPCLVRA